jgi:glycerol-3-phosphate dehydrogenase
VQRDPGRLADRTFDILVIGAGIYGATIAWDAVSRGLSVAIVDRADFGGATSFHSAKTVHGGLRSLQRGNLPDMREFIRERRALSRIAPHLVHPMPFAVPTYRSLMRSRLVMRTALLVNDLVAYDRNDLADPGKHLPSSGVVSRDEALALYPGFDRDAITGAAVWHDCQMYSTDRMTLSFLLSAADAGAVAANYVEVTGFLMSGRRMEGSPRARHDRRP